MSCLRFGVYVATGERFDVGSTPLLDCYDGFFDQALEGRREGECIRFVVQEEAGALSWETPDEVLRWRRELPGKMLVTARLLEDGSDRTQVRITRARPFQEVLEEKASQEEEAIDEVLRHDRMWKAIHESENPTYGYVLRCDLPGREHMLARRACVQHATILRRGGPREVTISTALLVDPIGSDSSVRVFVPGDNDPESCAIFDLTDPAEYERLLAQRVEAARSPDERTFWTYLIGRP